MPSRIEELETQILKNARELEVLKAQKDDEEEEDIEGTGGEEPEGSGGEGNGGGEASSGEGSGSGTGEIEENPGAGKEEGTEGGSSPSTSNELVGSTVAFFNGINNMTGVVLSVSDDGLSAEVQTGQGNALVPVSDLKKMGTGDQMGDGSSGGFAENTGGQAVIDDQGTKNGGNQQ